jgi:carboxymethylenebutenolidase
MKPLTTPSATLIALLSLCFASASFAAQDDAKDAAPAAAQAPAAGGTKIPPGEQQAKAALEKSPRHGEWVDITVPGSETPLRTYVVYPERKDNAPVVIVIHEIFGLTDWIRSVADQLGADGFIAVAPDLLSGRGPGGGGTEAIGSRDEVTKLVRGIKPEDVVKGLNAVRDYGMKLPAANGKTATVGFCWGGGMSFLYATAQPGLNAAVVYYGTSPSDASAYEKINAAVQGHYGGDDQRVNATIPTAREDMKKINKTYEPHVYEGAGHGFLRAQADRNGANLKAAQQAWPATVEFIRRNTEKK